MGLLFYEHDRAVKDKYLSSAVITLSSIATAHNVLRSYHNSGSHTVIVKRLFIRNNDLSKYYENVIVSLTGQDVASSSGEPYYQQAEQPFVVKLHKGWLQPDSITWMNKAEFNSITYDNLGTRNNPDVRFYPFWIAIECYGYDTTKIINDILSTDLTLQYIAEEYDHGRARERKHFK